MGVFFTYSKNICSKLAGLLSAINWYSIIVAILVMLTTGLLVCLSVSSCCIGSRSMPCEKSCDLFTWLFKVWFWPPGGLPSMCALWEETGDGRWVFFASCRLRGWTQKNEAEFVCAITGKWSCRPFCCTPARHFLPRLFTYSKNICSKLAGLLSAINWYSIIVAILVMLTTGLLVCLSVNSCCIGSCSMPREISCDLFTWLFKVWFWPPGGIPSVCALLPVRELATERATLREKGVWMWWPNQPSCTYW